MTRWVWVIPSRRRLTPPPSTCSPRWIFRRTRATGSLPSSAAGRAWRPRSWRTPPRPAVTAPRPPADRAGRKHLAAVPGHGAGPGAVSRWTAHRRRARTRLLGATRPSKAATRPGHGAAAVAAGDVDRGALHWIRARNRRDAPDYP